MRDSVFAYPIGVNWVIVAIYVPALRAGCAKHQNHRKFGGTMSASPATPSSTPAFRADCPCPKLKCKLRGQCVECRAKHGRKGQLPRCER